MQNVLVKKSVSMHPQKKSVSMQKAPSIVDGRDSVVIQSSNSGVYTKTFEASSQKEARSIECINGCKSLAHLESPDY